DAQQPTRVGPRERQAEPADEAEPRRPQEPPSGHQDEGEESEGRRGADDHALVRLCATAEEGRRALGERDEEDRAERAAPHEHAEPLVDAPRRRKRRRPRPRALAPVAHPRRERHERRRQDRDLHGRERAQACQERVREVVGPTPDQPAIEAPLPGGRSVDPVVQIERAADHHRERPLGLRHVADGRAREVEPRHQEDEREEDGRRGDREDPEMSPLGRLGDAIHGRYRAFAHHRKHRAIVQTMPAHSVGSGTISFGLVSIPVKLYTAAAPQSVSFNLLHAKCGSRIKLQNFCPVCNEVVDRAALVRGYEFAKDQYVRVADEELKSLEGEASKVIDIAEFVPLTSVDPIYFEKTYYLGPDKGGEKAYRLLADAMGSHGRIALAKFVMRGKESL